MFAQKIFQDLSCLAAAEQTGQLVLGFLLAH